MYISKKPEFGAADFFSNRKIINEYDFPSSVLSQAFKSPTECRTVCGKGEKPLDAIIIRIFYSSTVCIPFSFGLNCRWRPHPFFIFFLCHLICSYYRFFDFFFIIVIFQPQGTKHSHALCIFICPPSSRRFYDSKKHVRRK